MPTRVIDLGDLDPNTSPKLYITNSGLGRYLALSYSWGEDVRHMTQLATTTIQAYQAAIPEEMTLSHREALQVARELLTGTSGSMLLVSSRKTKRIRLANPPELLRSMGMQR